MYSLYSWVGGVFEDTYLCVPVVFSNYFSLVYWLVCNEITLVCRVGSRVETM